MYYSVYTYSWSQLCTTVTFQDQADQVKVPEPILEFCRPTVLVMTRRGDEGPKGRSVGHLGKMGQKHHRTVTYCSYNWL